MRGCLVGIGWKKWLHESKVAEEVSAVFAAPKLKVQRGEKADYLTPFDRSVEGDVTLDRRTHTKRVQRFLRVPK